MESWNVIRSTDCQGLAVERLASVLFRLAPSSTVLPLSFQIHVPRVTYPRPPGCAHRSGLGTPKTHHPIFLCGYDSTGRWRRSMYIP